VFRVWYKACPEGSTVHRVEQYANFGTGGLSTLDHTDPGVIARVFRRYALNHLVVFHTQSHFHNIVTHLLARDLLHPDDPLGALLAVCTASTPFIDQLVGNKLFFGSEELRSRQQASVARIGLQLPDGFSPGSFFGTSSVRDLVASSHRANLLTRRRHADARVDQFAPVMGWCRQFHRILGEMYRHIPDHPRFAAGRQRLVEAYATNCAPYSGHAPTPTTVLDNTVRMVLMHHYTHSFHVNGRTLTSQLFTDATMPLESSFFRATDRAPEEMTFGNSFVACVGRRSHPGLCRAIDEMLVAIHTLARESRADGVHLFDDLASSITI
jgi:hypothetical protein